MKANLNLVQQQIEKILDTKVHIGNTKKTSIDYEMESFVKVADAIDTFNYLDQATGGMIHSVFTDTLYETMLMVAHHAYGAIGKELLTAWDTGQTLYLIDEDSGQVNGYEVHFHFKGVDYVCRSARELYLIYKEEYEKQKQS